MVLNMKNRVLHSSTTSAPASRSKDASVRKDYAHNSTSAVFSSVQSQSSGVCNRFRKVMVWSNTRKVPLINCMIVVIAMVATLSTSLLLRTQMAELSFEQTAVQSRIARLRQDVEAKQAKLDTLEAELPARAQRMGMVPQQGSIAIDLSDYAAKRKRNRADRKQSSKQITSHNQQQNQQNQVKQEKH